MRWCCAPVEPISWWRTFAEILLEEKRRARRAEQEGAECATTDSTGYPGQLQDEETGRNKFVDGIRLDEVDDVVSW
jgi:hypothetical protein